MLSNGSNPISTYPQAIIIDIYSFLSLFRFSLKGGQSILGLNSGFKLNFITLCFWIMPKFRNSPYI